MSAERGDLVGRRIGGLDVIGLLGEGAMAQVYLARHPGLGMTRAIKVIRALERDKALALARFRREASVLSRLHHNHIVHIIDVGALEEDDAYLVMEYIKGSDLSVLLAASGPLALGSALRVLRDVADALRYAHSRGVLHRDLKPANIVARDNDPAQTKIIDFGLVRLVEDLQRTKLTGGDAILGSPQYMSPEQAQARDELTCAIDVYALAGLAYFLVTGEPVFAFRDYPTIVDVLRAQCTATPGRLSERCGALGIGTEVAASLDDFLLECLAKNPTHRPSSAEVAAYFDAAYVAEMVNRAPTRDQSARRIPPRVGEENLAQTLWQHPPDSSDRAGRQRHLGAIQQKAEQALLALSAELTDTTSVASGIEEQLAKVQHNMEELERLELERALLDAKLEGVQAEDAQRDTTQALVAERKDTLRKQFRELFLAVMKDAPEASSDRAATLLKALLTLVDSHRDISESE